jgi:S-adenosylmethionine:tRNA ribosyltransferase-isomerase
VHDLLDFPSGLVARVMDKMEDGLVSLTFDREGTKLDALIDSIGEVPLPPYIASRRKADKRDDTDYQTTFAEARGSVAAPTAGLHFTPALFRALEQRGLEGVTVTLHVGGGTFLPVKSEDTKGHVMHPEWGCVTEDAADTINTVRAAGGRIVAVGTTSLRLLESAADGLGRILPFKGETRIFITPGYRIRGADLLITNFHLPCSTLLMLVQAFGGVEPLRAAYAHAIADRYRFYSYGDACLIHRAE